MHTICPCQKPWNPSSPLPSEIIPFSEPRLKDGSEITSNPWVLFLYSFPSSLSSVQSHLEPYLKPLYASKSLPVHRPHNQLGCFENGNHVIWCLKTLPQFPMLLGQNPEFSKVRTVWFFLTSFLSFPRPQACLLFTDSPLLFLTLPQGWNDQLLLLFLQGDFLVSFRPR